MKKTIAFFDFDGTLIKGNSLPRFLWYYTFPLIFILKSFYLMPVLFKYVFGLVDNHTAKEQVFVIFFAGERKVKFIEKARLFSISIIPSLVKEEAVIRLRWHWERKHDCILVSASIQEYLGPWAERMGFSKVIATKLEVDNNGKITGKFLGKNCNGAEKVKRIEEYLSSVKEYEIYAYGDSHGDKELLKIAHHPFYKSFKEEKAYPHG